MRIRQVSLRSFALPMIMLVLAGCLEDKERSNFVDGGVQPPVIGNSVPTINGNPSTSIKIGQAYSFLPSAADPDGDSITFSIVNQPGWATFDTATGQLSGTPANVGNFADIAISVSDGQDSSSLADFSINVTDDIGTPTNTAPTISGNPPISINVGESYSFTANASDADGDTLTFSIANLPGWASFDASSGQLSGTPATGNVGNFPGILISVSDGQDSASLATFAITVTDTPNNTAPTISGTPSPSVKVGESYSFMPTAADADGDALTFSIQNMPPWASFDTSSGQLSGSPVAVNVGIFSGIRIRVTDGQVNASLTAFTITVADDGGTPTNAAPTISGNPPTNIGVGESYSFTPNAADADGDSLTFSIQNGPSWASFDTSSGQLSGIPASGDVGSFTGILISVSDGQDSANLGAFRVDVASSNGAPSISGNPPITVKVAEFYSFTPNASDPDGDSLTFSIQNRPSWASFNTSSGQLSGTPASGDVGTYSNINISVSDGQESASLSGFTIDVTQVATQSTTLSWTPPTQNEDGTTLVDLAGYTIHYGNASGIYTTQIRIDNPGVTTYVVENLTAGTYYFVATAFNSADVNSRFSGEAVKTLP